MRGGKGSTELSICVGANKMGIVCVNLDVTAACSLKQRSSNMCPVLETSCSRDSQEEKVEKRSDSKVE